MKRLLTIVTLFLIVLLPQRPGCARELSIALDIGHSRGNSGALSARNRPEYDYNRAMALTVLREMNRNTGLRAFLVDAAGSDISLRKRAELINEAKPDLFISIHHDSVKPHYLSPWTWKGTPALFCDLFRGYSVFISDKNAKAEGSRSFALALGANLRKAGFIPSAHHAEPVEGEGKLPVDVALGVYRYDNLVVLKEAKCPALLLECGIIKNRGEELLLRNRAYRIRLAKAIRSAVEEFKTIPSRRAQRAGRNVGESVNR